MKRILPRIPATLLFVAVLAGVVVLLAALGVAVARRGGMGEGSYKYARQWRDQLLACQSLDEVSRHFNCFMIEETPGMGLRSVGEFTRVAGRPEALVKSFSDGRWIACAHADSHNRRPGCGTIVSRDSSGEVHIFFGHVCGTLIVHGDTLEEFYIHLRGYNRVKEVFLKE
jgi:hypothetical protein